MADGAHEPEVEKKKVNICLPRRIPRRWAPTPGDNDFTLREYDKSTGGRSASSSLLSKGGKWGFLVGDNGGGGRKREGGPSFDLEFFLLPPSHVELSYARRSWFSLRCNLTRKNFRFRCIYRVWSDLRLKLATTRTLLSIQSRDFCLHRWRQPFLRGATSDFLLSWRRENKGRECCLPLAKRLSLRK
jgi:hypothetical protein